MRCVFYRLTLQAAVYTLGPPSRQAVVIALCFMLPGHAAALLGYNNDRPATPGLVDALPRTATSDTGADLGFYNCGCPIHLKGAPEVERQRRQVGWGRGERIRPLPRKFLHFLYQNAFYAFPMIFIDTVTVFFSKRPP